jgi:chemotaxis protein MotB
MKTVFMLAMGAMLLFTSCASHKKCSTTLEGNKPSGGLSSKRYKAAIAERDSLCLLVDVLKMDTVATGSLTRALRRDIENQIRDNQDLKQATGEQLSKLSDELNRKQKELESKQKDLNDKEKVLADKDARLQNLEKLVKERDEMLSNIMGTLRKALDAFPKDELNIEIKDGKIYVSMLDKLLFKSGSATVEPRGIEAISKLAPVLISNPDLGIVIEGHTDNVPIKTSIFKDNWDLSTYRATSVLRILLDNKLNAKQLVASGKGEFSPVAANDTPEGKSLNRRTEIILTPKLDALFQLLDSH